MKKGTLQGSSSNVLDSSASWRIEVVPAQGRNDASLVFRL